MKIGMVVDLLQKMQRKTIQMEQQDSKKATTTTAILKTN